jgi:hypothetical protein
MTMMNNAARLQGAAEVMAAAVERLEQLAARLALEGDAIGAMQARGVAEQFSARQAQLKAWAARIDWSLPLEEREYIEANALEFLYLAKVILP